MSRIVQSFTDTPNNLGTVYKGQVTEDYSFLPYYNVYQYAYTSQVFTTGSSYIITGVWVKLYQNTTFRAANLTIVIQAADVNDYPTGADLATATINVQNLTLDPAGEWIKITFDASYTLAATTDYAIVIRPENPETEIYIVKGILWTGIFDDNGRGARYAYVASGGPPAAWTLNSRHLNFATLADAVDVEKTSPVHNSTVSIGATTILDWEDPGSGATKYGWVIYWDDPIWGPSSASGTRTAPITEADVSSAILYIYNTGARECTWIVRPYIGGEYIDDDDPWALKIVGPPPTAINPTPADTASSIAMAPLLTWELDGPPGGDDYFFIYLNTDIDKMSTAAGLQVGWRTSQELQVLSGLVANTTYYWQVHVANTQGWSESEIWSFTTRNFAPPVVSGGEVTPTGENNMMTIKRLVVAARDRIYYEAL